MSLWHCPVHGLYGGDVFCPRCNKNGEHVTIGDDAPETASDTNRGTQVK